MKKLSDSELRIILKGYLIGKKDELIENKKLTISNRTICEIAPGYRLETIAICVNSIINELVFYELETYTTYLTKDDNGCRNIEVIKKKKGIQTGYNKDLLEGILFGIIASKNPSGKTKRINIEIGKMIIEQCGIEDNAYNVYESVKDIIETSNLLNMMFIKLHLNSECLEVEVTKTSRGFDITITDKFMVTPLQER